MAGNIIPAIATTNAIVAGLIVIQAIKLLCNLDESQSETFVVYADRKNRFFFTESYPAPNPSCTVCQCTYMELTCDLSKTTIRNVLEAMQDKILQGRDEVSIEEQGRLLYDPDFDDNVDTVLTKIGIKPAATLSFVVDDNEDDGVYYVLSVMVSNKYVVFNASGYCSI